MRSAYPDLVTIRPRRMPVLLPLGGIAIFAVLIIAGAFRKGQPLVSWFGVAVLIGCVPLADWLLRSIRVGTDGLMAGRWLHTTVLPFTAIRAYGTRRSWSFHSGQWTYLTVVTNDGTRVDLPVDAFRRADISGLFALLAERLGPPSSGLPRPRIAWAPAFAVIGALITIGISLVLTSIALPATLSAERLFSEGAGAGLIAGFALGTMLGRLSRHVPVAVGALASVTLLAAFGSAALVLNVTGTGSPLRTVPVTIVSRRSFVERGHDVYVVDVQVDGARKRLMPNAAGWQRLGSSDTFAGCVREGQLGFAVIVQLTHACHEAREPH